MDPPPPWPGLDVRLFVAIELGEPVIGEAVAALRALRTRIAKSNSTARITWTADENLHVTLSFIGEVGPDRAEAVLGVLRDPIPMAPFPLSLGGVAAFPDLRRPRVIVLNIDRGQDRVRALAQTVALRLLGVGVPLEGRDYHPHISLGRVRHPGGLRMAHLLSEMPQPRTGTTTVEAITLFESELSSGPPRYRRLLSTRLMPA